MKILAQPKQRQNRDSNILLLLTTSKPEKYW